MKFTLSWLKDHLDTTASVDEIATKLSAIGLEVEEVLDPSAKLGSFVVARVLEARPHPNADRLRVAKVDIGQGKPPVEVVCGAPNCESGMLAVFAPIGTYVPGTGITLDQRPVRGVVSNGMLCSEKELELSEESNGIIKLPDAMAPHVGQRYVDAIGLADPVFEVKLTPNRADCTGVRGIARDLFAAGLGTLRTEPELGPVEGKVSSPISVSLEFTPDTADACPVFAGRYVAGVVNGPSPEWLQRRLKAIGLRPRNILVDITNYIAFDRGRPLHVFDADKLQGSVRARLGRPGETIVGLDDKEYAIDPSMCVIADDSGPLGLAGIIGGKATGCTESTSNVFIESAYFDPLRTAATGRRLGLKTDARYRFERGVDPQFVKGGLDLATDMIVKLAGGTPSRSVIAGKAPDTREPIAFELSRIGKLSGMTVGEKDARRILADLGFEVKGRGGAVKVTAPSWRPDVHGAADLVEEVVRIVGLDSVPSTPLPRTHGVMRAVLTEKQKRSRRARRVLAGRGLVEAVTWSFIPKVQAQLFGGGDDALDLANPISVELSSMRPGLLPGLVAALERNRNRGFRDVGLFEVGQSYRGTAPDQQLLIAAGVRAGRYQITGVGRHWHDPASEADAFDVKADAMALLSALGFDARRARITRDAPAYFHPGRSGALRLDPRSALAYFGEIHPGLLAKLDVEAPVAAFEVFLDALPPEKQRGKARPAMAATDLLPVRRDIAFVLAEDVAAADVVRVAQAADKALVAEVNVFDLFKGESVGTGKKSLAIEIVLQPREKTLTDADIEAITGKIIAEVRKATGGEVRG